MHQICFSNLLCFLKGGCYSSRLLFLSCHENLSCFLCVLFVYLSLLSPSPSGAHIRNWLQGRVVGLALGVQVTCVSVEEICGWCFPSSSQATFLLESRTYHQEPWPFNALWYLYLSLFLSSSSPSSWRSCFNALGASGEMGFSHSILHR